MSSFLPGARAAALSVSRSAMRVEGARAFSGTAATHSKLGRTPISLPPGVQVKVGERWVQKDLTSYLEKGRRTVTVEGPLGRSLFLLPCYRAWRVRDWAPYSWGRPPAEV